MAAARPASFFFWGTHRPFARTVSQTVVTGDDMCLFLCEEDT